MQQSTHKVYKKRLKGKQEKGKAKQTPTTRTKQPTLRELGLPYQENPRIERNHH